MSHVCLGFTALSWIHYTLEIRIFHWSSNILITIKFQYSERFTIKLQYSKRFTIKLQYSERFTFKFQYSERFTINLQYSERFTIKLQYSEKFTIMLQYSEVFTIKLQYSERFTIKIKYSERFTIKLQYSEILAEKWMPLLNQMSSQHTWNQRKLISFRKFKINQINWTKKPMSREKSMIKNDKVKKIEINASQPQSSSTKIKGQKGSL